MKKLIVLLSVLSLSGCFYQKVQPIDIKSAESFCADKGGVHHIKTWFDGDVEIYCKNHYGSNKGNYGIDVSRTYVDRYLVQEYLK
mgnify:CR=1 FL=1